MKTWVDSAAGVVIPTTPAVDSLRLATPALAPPTTALPPASPVAAHAGSDAQRSASPSNGHAASPLRPARIPRYGGWRAAAPTARSGTRAGTAAGSVSLCPFAAWVAGFCHFLGPVSCRSSAFSWRRARCYRIAPVASGWRPWRQRRSRRLVRRLTLPLFHAPIQRAPQSHGSSSSGLGWTRSWSKGFLMLPSTSGPVTFRGQCIPERREMPSSLPIGIDTFGGWMSCVWATPYRQRRSRERQPG